MQISGWGQTRTIHANVLRPRSNRELCAAVADHAPLIARGMGRSYGDSSLASTVIELRSMDKLLSFDDASGLLHCQAGVSLARIIDALLPRGWFLPVVPGTGQVSIGGAIASDVHGKNHHRTGSFCRHVTALTLCLPDGSLQTCSREANTDLFHAVCGGMGLIGIVTDATLQLRRIPGMAIQQQTIGCRSLEEVLDRLQAHQRSEYSVAWLDLMNGRQAPGLLLLGEHSDAPAGAAPSSTASIPVRAPFNLVQKPVVRLHGRLHRWRAASRADTATVGIRSFFFPLDRLANWNRLYGPRGFQQFQFVVPETGAREALQQVLSILQASAETVSLAVLKKLGPASEGLLSFPVPGYTLALDFPATRTLDALLDRLEVLVVGHGGRIYLSKDSRMSPASFRSTYPDWETFAALRARIGADRVFRSAQSDRLGL